MGIDRGLLAGAFAAALVAAALSLPAPAASASTVELKITETWSGTLPTRVEPGKSVTLLTSFGQSTYNQPIQISGLSFDLWSSRSTVDRDVQVEFMNPVTHAWVAVAPDNGQGWSYEFDTFLTEEPGKTYSSGVRFTIDDEAPAGTWTVDYPTVWGVTTQTALPYGSISFPAGPTRTFAFKSPAVSAPVTTHSTAPSSARTTHAATKSSPSPSPRHTATSAAPATPSAAETTATATAAAPAAAAPDPSAAPPSATPIGAVLDADAHPSSSAAPTLAAGAAAASVVLLLALGLWRRLRRRGA